MGIGLCNVKGGSTSMGCSGGKSLLDCREWLHGESSCEDDYVDDLRLVVFGEQIYMGTSIYEHLDGTPTGLSGQPLSGPIFVGFDGNAPFSVRGDQKNLYDINNKDQDVFGV
ncbi:hypothetical protein Tco_1151799 [Tanacetum coccineum]